jgi:hypothetical protein
MADFLKMRSLDCSLECNEYCFARNEERDRCIVAALLASVTIASAFRDGMTYLLANARRS